MSVVLEKGIIDSFDPKKWEGTVKAGENLYRFDRSYVRQRADLRSGHEVTVLLSEGRLLEMRTMLKPR